MDWRKACIPRGASLSLLTLTHHRRRDDPQDSSENSLHDMTMHIGQAIVPALVLEGQSSVIDAQEMQDGGLEVMDVNRVLGDVVTEVIGSAVSDAGLDATAGHPDREATRMMIPAIGLGVHISLHEHGPAEFARPDNQRF